MPYFRWIRYTPKHLEFPCVRYSGRGSGRGLERSHWRPADRPHAKSRQYGCFCRREPHTDHRPALRAVGPTGLPRTWHWAPGYNKLRPHEEDVCRDDPPAGNSNRPLPMEQVPVEREVSCSPEMDYAGARRPAAYHTTVEKLPTLIREEVVSPGENQVVIFLA